MISWIREAYCRFPEIVLRWLCSVFARGVQPCHCTLMRAGSTQKFKSSEGRRSSEQFFQNERIPK